MSGHWPAEQPRVVDRTAMPGQPEPDRIRVVHVITRFIAGAGGNTLMSATGMDPDRYEVWVAGCPGGPLWDQARAAGVHTVELDGFTEVISPLADLRVLWQLVRLLRRVRPSIVHTHSAKGGVLGRVAGRLCRVPVVIHTFHGFSVHPSMSRARRTAYLLVERAAGRLTDAFAAVAPRVAREAVETGQARPGTVTVVPSAVAVEAIVDTRAADARAVVAGLVGRGDCPVVGTVGRIDAQKVPLDFVRVAAAVQNRRPDVRFVWVGEGPLEQQVRAEAQRVGARVLFTGFRADAAVLAAGFDAYLVTSEYEGLGRALTEALAAARPVVATAVNGIPDLVTPGATGLLVRPGDIPAMADAVLWLLDHPVEAAAMGRAGRARVDGHFTQARMCADLDALYSAQLGLPEPPPCARTDAVREPVLEAAR